MIIENPNKLNSKETFDVVIIGAGPAGISLALDLEEKKVKCCLLEAGGIEFTEKSQEFYKTSFTDNFPNNLEYSRLRMFGGTTGHWGGTCRTLDDYDFLKWPINKEDLDPYLPKALKYLNLSNKFKEKNISKDIKIVEFRNSNVRFGDYYLNRVQNSKYISLILNAYVTNFTQESNVLKKIKFTYQDGKKYNVNGKFFVLASGGVENSRLLLHFRDLGKGIFNNDVAIGNYWYEHPYTKIGECLLNKKNLEQYEDLYSIPYAFGAGKNSKTINFSPRKNYIFENKILNTCIFLTYEKNDKSTKALIKDLSCYAPTISKKLFSLFDKGLVCKGILRSSWEQEPEYNNCIKLDYETKDYHNIPRVKLNYSLSEKSQMTARKFLSTLSDFFIKKNIGRIKAEDYMIDENLPIESEAGYHHMGGTIIGIDPKNSVVDINLKIHGSKNFFVLGSSTFPSGGHANPTLTILQLSFRLSDNIQNLITKIS